MRQPIRTIETWMKQLDFKNPEKNFSAFYIQVISLLVIIGASILGGVYFIERQFSYLAIISLEIMVYSVVVVLLRFKKLRVASYLFVIAALGMLTFGVLSVGSIHASSSVLFPVTLVFASLLLDRKPYIVYALLCVASIGFIIYVENQRLIPIIYRPDPPEFPLFITYALVVVVTGIIVRLITENLQNSLRKSRQYTRELSNQKAMLDRVGQAVMGCQMDGTIVYWNQAAIDIYGWDAKEIIGRKYYDAAPTQLSAETTEEIRATLRKGEMWSGELMIQKRDQSWLPVIVSISPLWDETGSISGWIGTAADLSEHAKLEEIDRRRADEMSLLYSLGVSLASGKTLYDTLLALQAEISNLIQSDAFYVAIYDEKTDKVSFPVFFHKGNPIEEAERNLHERPGLTGAVIFSEKLLYLPDVIEPEVKDIYNPVDDSKLFLHTFLGVPLISNGRTIGMLSVQSRQINAYTPEQAQLMENIAIQAAIAIDKANLLDQLKQELADRTRAEDQLRKRELILEAITFAAEQFLRTSNWREKIDIVLERLGMEFGASHAYLFEKHKGSDGETLSSMTHEWTAPDCISDLEDEEFQNMPLNPMDFDRMYKILDRGEPLVGSRSFFNAEEWEYMRLINVKALLEMRIVINGNHWGTIGFDDIFNEREWTSMEVDVIKVAANVLGAAIKRQIDEEALKDELAERKRAEQALIFSEEKFSKAFHTTPVMMTIEDANNIFVDVNESFIDTIGFAREDIIGRRASELNILLAPGESQKANSVLENQDTFKDIELNFRKKHGEMFTVLMSIEKFYVNDIVYTLTSALDITERKHAEAEREKLIEELGVKNAELESFTYTVSHDLKSPLVTINGFLGYLEIDAASGNMERLKKDTSRIQDAVNKMQRLLNELLELSRIGRIMNVPENVPFTDLIRDALEIVHGRLAEKEIIVDIQSNLPVIYGDKPRLVEALQNLFDNAAKYMGEQLNPRIEVGQRAEDAQYDKPVFFVRDNGMGIAHEYHERIFGLFNKLDAKSEGTGVGLALVKRIIEIHGGKVWVESEVGQGSTFYFTLSKAAGLMNNGNE